jgi:hypothetical protein
MIVKMLDSHSGVVWPDQPAVHLRNGEEHEVPAQVGEKWVRIGLAVAVPDVVVDEVAVDDKHDAGDARTLKPRARARRDEE